MSSKRFGTIVQRGDKWLARFRVPKHLAHLTSSVKISRTFRTKGAARAWLAEQETAIERGTWLTPEQQAAQARKDSFTFGDYAPICLEHLALGGGHKTFASNLKIHILPYWKDTPLKSITTADVYEWINTTLTKKPVRKNVFATFGRILRKAQEEGYIEQLPLVRGMLGSDKNTRLIPSQATKGYAMTQAEYVSLANEVPEYMRLYVLISCALALRAGEALELRWKDYDPQQHTITISRQITEEGTIQPPKTQAGHRTLTVPQQLATLLNQQLTQEMTGREGLIFHKPSQPHKHMARRTIQYNTSRAAQRLGLPHVTLHDFRRTGATLALQIPGINPVDVQAMLGHEELTMTLRYAQTNQNRQALIAQAQDAQLTIPEPGTRLANQPRTRQTQQRSRQPLAQVHQLPTGTN